MSEPLPSIAVVGLGYVGLPVAAEFGKVTKVVGFDISGDRIAALQKFVDHTSEVSSEELKAAKLLSFTANPSDIAACDIVIVCVPTPVDSANKPDFTPLVKASETVGKHLKTGAIVVYESTVYPGATEEICVPVLEKCSGKTWKKDFYVGYSPERINPGDKVHTLPRIKKIVSGDTDKTLATLSKVYGSIITAGIHEAESIKVAEAAKIIENTQRDINIALMNECAMIFGRLGIDTQAVLDAAGTKWNFLGFRPGLVGGHCIGVDPYYLTQKAEMVGHHPRIILAGRGINDGMARYVAEQTVKTMLRAGRNINRAKVLVMGLTFKEDVPDLRNSKVADVVQALKEFNIGCIVHDPVADMTEAEHEYGLKLVPWNDVPVCDAAVVAVAHSSFKSMGVTEISKKINKNGCFIDVKSAFDRHEVADHGLALWRL
jgi:UDP-N-acetyl-D-galactosamine dehydrogenase